jgi:hypothetical protein
MLQNLSKTVKFLAMILLSFQCQAQTYEWVNFFGGKSSQVPMSINVDDAGSQYSTFRFLEQIKFDTITLDTLTGAYNGLVVKQDINGKIIWYRQIGLIKSDNNGVNIYQFASILNSKGNLVVIICTSHDMVIGADTIKGIGGSVLGNIFRLEFNTSGKLLNSRHLISGALTFVYNFNLVTQDKNDNLYVSVVGSYTRVKVYDTVGSTTLNFGSQLRYANLKFSNSGKKLEWVTYSPSMDLNSIKVDKDGNLYAVGRWQSGIPYTFMGKTIKNPQLETGVVFIWDKNGKDKNWFWLQASANQPNENKSTFYNMAVYDTNSVLVSGVYLGDSAKFGDKWYKNNKYGSYHFVAMYDAQGNSKWVNIEDTSYSTNMDIKFPSDISHYKDSFYYVSFFIQNAYDKPIIFDGQKYLPNPKGVGINMKLDDKGNILWAFRSRYPFVAMGTDKINNLYFIGNGLDDTMTFGSFKSTAVSYDGYIGKTFDYAIYRGDIYAGPYCAGDSLMVPYTKSGIYGDDNIFIAEISDESGNFTGKEREIGRLKTNGNGTIQGALPMFEVASSGNYRIRIRSTSPQAQSYYKFDKLRLLIYSRDKADPGPPAYVCPGDTIQLNTYGGTKWMWSPQYRMNDASIRQPLVWPHRDTVYQIIIGDSSGCGAPDTAYKQIFTRIKADFTANDICESDSAVFVNQSPDAKSFNWNFGDGLNSKKSNPKHLYNIGGITKTFNVKMLAILGQGCADSITKAITINANPISDFSYSQTGTKLDLKATQANNIKYLWKFGSKDSIITTATTCTFNITKPEQSKVCLIVTNLAGCKSQTCNNISLNITDLSKPSGFKLYPNPSTGEFIIEIANPQKAISISVYDLLGNLIKLVETSPNKLFYKIDLNVSNGIYLVRVRNEENVFNQKVTVDK